MCCLEIGQCCGRRVGHSYYDEEDRSTDSESSSGNVDEKAPQFWKNLKETVKNEEEKKRNFKAPRPKKDETTTEK